MTLIDDLARASCANPFEALGPFYNEKTGKTLIRAWLPGACSVELLSIRGKKSQGSFKQVANSALFEIILTWAKGRLYRLSVTTEEGHYIAVDPYQLKQPAYDAVHYVESQPQNLYRQLGAQLKEAQTDGGQKVQGVSFAVYAPNASAVSVIGDFNYFDGCCHPMQKTDQGYWVLFVPNLKPGYRYKYQIKDQNGYELPHKADPVGFYAEQYPSHASIIYDHDQYQWQDKAWMNAKKDPYHAPMSVYEVHLGSWKKPAEANRKYLSYVELAKDLIPYVKDMGYTHIELLPVAEHPFDGSWGYQPVGLFAPTSRFGNPDDFKAFVDQCHQAGIGVIMDWVPAHFPEDGHGLARFDGTHLYEYEDPRKGWHPDWHSCIYDFGKDTVRHFLVANALYWLEKFHIDGLRVDAVASMLYLDYSRKEGEWIPNVDGGNHNYEAISLLQWMNTEVYKHFPHAMTIAEESTSFAKVSRPVHEGGLGFGFKWNMGWMHDSLHYISKDSAYRRYHHNEVTFSMVYAYDENFVLPISHDEVVHGKGSLIRKMPGDEWQQAANHRCYAAFMYAHPGKKLNFMGNELAQSSEWNHDGQLAWHLLDYDKHQGVQRLYKDLNRLYQNLPALHQLDHDPAGFYWLDHQNAEMSLLAFARQSQGAKEITYVISNFTPTPRQGFRLGVKDAGDYQLLLNSDDSQYWGSGYEISLKVKADAIPAHGQDYSISFNLPPLATLYFGLRS